MLSSEVSPETVPEAPEAPLLAHLATAVADAVTDAFHATLTAAKALGAPQTQTALPPTTLFPDDNTLQPLTIWIFWGDGAIPPLVRACIASWRRHNALHTVRVVSNADLETGLLLQDDTDDSAWPFGLGPFVAAAPTYGFESVQKLSNWVRLSLLERHGGVWVDASTWCTGPVERWVSGSPAPKLSGFSTRQNPRVFENWAIGSPAPKHVGVVAWRAQLREAHRIGRDVYIAKAFAEDFDLDALWKSDEGVAIALPYLWCHLAMLVAQRKAKGKFDSTMVVHDSAQYARYRTQVFDERVLGRPRVEMHIARPLDWAEMPQCHRVAWDLASGPRRPCDAVFVKLVNRERAEAQRLLDAGEFAQGSVLAEIHADLRAALTEEHQVAVVESGRERRA